MVLMVGRPNLAPGRFYLERAVLEGTRGRTLALVGRYTVKNRTATLYGRRFIENQWDDAIGMGGSQGWDAEMTIEAVLEGENYASVRLKAFDADVVLKRADFPLGEGEGN